MKALIINKPWMDLILSGKKSWELRGSGTKIRGKVALIQSQSGTVVGICSIQDSVGPLSLVELRRNKSFHCVPDDQIEEIAYPKTFGWVLKNAQRLPKPIQYKHPSGAVIWVKLNQNNCAGYDQLMEVDQSPSSIRKPSEPKKSIAPVQSIPANQHVPNDLIFDAFSATVYLTQQFGTPNETKYANRWSIGPDVGIGLEKRGSKVTLYTGINIDLRGKNLAVEKVQTGRGSNYGIQSNMKSVPGCEAGRIVQKITLRNNSELELFVNVVKQVKTAKKK